MELDTARHIRYWQRCYKSMLPHHYTSMDSIRLTLGFFIIAAFDLLSSPPSNSPPADPNGETPSSQSILPAIDRSRLRAWVLSLRHRSGGFCGSPHHVLPEEFSSVYNGENRASTTDDPENANIAATYSALLTLGILADDTDESAQQIYKDVDRVATLIWLKKLQRPDGSFGELVRSDGTIGGGKDMRYCYMAATIRWILRGDGGDGTLDFNVDSFVSYIRQSQVFDGGIAENAMGESHAGYAYCAVAALSILDLAAKDPERPNRYLREGIPDIPALVHWLVMRQFAYLDEGSDEDIPTTTPQETPILDIGSLSVDDHTVTGFSGRLNKIADTCYVYWATAALRMLGHAIERPSARAYLLEKTQHIIGGFGKHAERPPDVYHSYLGLAALTTMAGDDGEPGLRKFEERLCISHEAASRVAKGRDYLKIR